MTADVSMKIKDDQERADLFNRLVRHFGAEVDRRGWVHVTCPRCGKEGRRQDIHFSFSLDHGCRCQACGYTANLKQLAAITGVLDDSAPAPVVTIRREPEVKHYRWMEQLPDYLERYTARPDRYAAWKSYRQVDYALVMRHLLGIGCFPEFSSQCQHERLIVPMLQNGKPVAFRGRSIATCEHKKWLSTAMGGRPPILFNGGVLLPAGSRARVSDYDLTDSAGAYCQGRVLLVVENPVDCILLESVGACAVATLGVTMWTRERPWTQLLKVARPRQVVVLYDHDLPGNGPANPREYTRMIEDWKANHNDAEPPLSNGLRLANELNEAGVPASVFHWPESTPLKADVGWAIEKFGLQKIRDIWG
jgi:hypothetical protein